MAIFSQQSEATKIDFRGYSTAPPVRNQCFSLPTEIQNKLKKLMEALKLNCGSIDLVYKSGKFFFLEVNPVGQFGWLSRECNYGIEKFIAKFLIYGQA